MKARFTNTVLAVACCASLLFGPSAQAETVVCDETTISVSAENLKAEELITAVGNACEIKMMLIGELFTDDTFSVQFEDMALRPGLDRILRVLNIPNHLLHFKKINGKARVVEISLIGDGGREQELTPGPEPASAKKPAAVKKRADSPKRTPPQEAPPKQEEEAAALAEQPQKGEEKQTEEDEEQEELIEKLYDIVEEQYDAEEDPDQAAVKELVQQALPPEMNGQIPEEILEELEDLAEE
jgi:hypothetical protein